MKMESIQSKEVTSTNGIGDIEPITPASLLACLDQFLLLATKSDDRRYFSKDKNGSQDEDEQVAIQSSLFLLQNLPSARNAALAYLAQALSKQVWQYMQRKEVGNKQNNFVSQIETLLTDLIESVPAVWCPLVSRWAVNQLGQWSVEWEGVILSRDTTLEERVAGWLDCTPARALGNLTVSCVAHDPDHTVAAILEASVHNGPVLNWLIAHVGCSFPATIINRVLSLGLRNYISEPVQNDSSQQLTSIDTILSHLANRHFSEIQCELQSVLLTTFSENPDKCSKAAIPFLLQLATINRSRAILRALTASLPQLLQSPHYLPSLTNQLSWWIPQYFPNNDSLIDILIHLCLDIRGPVACEIMYLLLQGSLSSSSPHENFATQLFHSLLGELGSIVYMRRNLPPLHPRVPLLSSLGNEKKGSVQKIGKQFGMTLSDLIEWTINLNNEVAIRKIVQLLTYIIIDQGPEPCSFILRNILISNNSINQNVLFLINCVIDAIVKQQSLINQPSKTLTSVLATIFQWDNKLNETSSALQKVEYMLTGGKVHKSYLHEALKMATFTNLFYLAKKINITKLSVSVLEIITQLPLEKPISLNHLFGLGHAVIFFFLACLENNPIEYKIKISNLCNKILSQLSHSSLGHSLLVRLIFEASFKPKWAYLFGANQEVFTENRDSNTELLKINHEFDSWVKLPKSHNTIFHAGKIGKYCSIQRQNKNKLTDEEVSLNIQLLLNLVAMCCHAQGTSQGATTVALLLVEYVSPDIIFNGFPWPEENIKFTFERDLAIKKTFEDFPIAWHYLELVARCRPALCYCSVLVRAITAALTAFWNTCSWGFAYQVPDQLKATTKLLEIMVVGQFLPEPFAVLPQMIEHLAPYEVVCILQDVWAYLRDHTPSPDRWVLLPNGYHQRPLDSFDSRYTDRCRKLIHAHIDIFGHLLSLMVKNVP